MITTARRCVSNTFTGVSNTSGSCKGNVNLITGCYVRRLTRTVNVSGGLKAAVTTALLLMMVVLYCLYSTSGNTGVTMTQMAYSQQLLGSSDSAGLHSDMIAVVTTMDGGKSHTNIAGGENNNGKKRRKKQKIKPPIGTHSVLTAADMYEPGFRIRNAGLCTSQTQLLVLITSAAAPSHSQNRQAIRMTWMNRYGPTVSMAFLVGTPQMSKTDQVAQQLEVEERALRMRLNEINSKYNQKQSSAVGSGDKLIDSLDGNSRLHHFVGKLEEGLDTQSMIGLNEAERVVQRVLGREHGRYGDIVQCQSRDTYTNLTLKSIAALEWTRQYCPSARYLLKTDDDMFIDVRRLLRFINKVEIDAIAETDINNLRPRESLHVNPNESPITGTDSFESAASSNFKIELPPTIWGRLAHGWRPIRQHNSKYYVSRAQYPGRMYPDFCTGPAYLMTRSAVNPLYEAALGKDFDVVDDEDEYQEDINDLINSDEEDQGKNVKSGNQTLTGSNGGGDKVVAKEGDSGKNTVPYLKLEDVYLTGVVAERLTRRAAERLARQKEIISLSDDNSQTANDNQKQFESSKTTKSKKSDIIVKIRRIHDDQFANKKITGRALERAICSGTNAGDGDVPNGSSGFSWFRWYWTDTVVNSKKKKKDQGVISIHMVKYFEQFDLWRRLMDGRTKCKS